MKSRKRMCMACASGVLVVSALLLAAYYLFAPLSLRARVSSITSAAYIRLFVEVPRGADAHRFYVNSGYTSPDAYIAHGAGILDYALTNSVEAVEDSLRGGFRYIEFDLLTTTDGHLVAAHTWCELRKMAGLPSSDSPMSLQEIRQIAREGKYTPVTAEDICRLLEQNKNVFVVTDRVTDYDLLLREIPYPDRLIVEVRGGINAYERAVRAGVRYPSLSVGNKHMMDIAYMAEIPIISLTDDDYFSTPVGIESVKRLHEKGITILLFNTRGSNYWEKPEFLQQYLGKVFSKIYSNSWGPHHLPHAYERSKN